MSNEQQLECIDIRREKARPAGSGLVIGGFFVFNAESQHVDQVAYSIGLAKTTVYKQVQEGDFPNAIDACSDSATTPCYRIPRTDVLDYINRRKLGAAL